jgi:class 3 adenylate cyclase
MVACCFESDPALRIVAARLSALVQGEGVILSQETKIRSGDGFDLHNLGPQSLKNVSESICAYRLIIK